MAPPPLPSQSRLRADEIWFSSAMLRKVGYSPGASVTHRPRKKASEQSCHVPLRMTTDEARSLKPTSAKFEIDWSATKERPRKASFS